MLLAGIVAAALTVQAWSGAPTDPDSDPDPRPSGEMHGLAPRGGATVDPFVAAPRERGTGLIVAGAVTTTGLLALRVWGSAMFLAGSLCDDPEGIERCPEDFSPLVGGFIDGLTPAAAGSLAMLGVGLQRRGRWMAYADMTGGGTIRDLRRREKLGWGLLGSGLAIWTGSIAVSWACFGADREPCFKAVHEAGGWVGAGLTIAGVAIAPYARGYRRQVSQARGPARISELRFAPSVAPTFSGLTVSGRF